MIHIELKHLYPDVYGINDKLFHIMLHGENGNGVVSYTYPIINSAYRFYTVKCVAPKTRKVLVSTLHFCAAIDMSEEDRLIWFLKFGEFLPTKLLDGVLCHN